MSSLVVEDIKKPRRAHDVPREWYTTDDLLNSATDARDVLCIS